MCTNELEYVIWGFPGSSPAFRTTAMGVTQACACLQSKPHGDRSMAEDFARVKNLLLGAAKTVSSLANQERVQGTASQNLDSSYSLAGLGSSSQLSHRSTQEPGSSSQLSHRSTQEPGSYLFTAFPQVDPGTW